MRRFEEGDRPFFRAVIHRLVPPAGASPRDPEAMHARMERVASGVTPYPMALTIRAPMC